MLTMTEELSTKRPFPVVIEPHTEPGVLDFTIVFVNTVLEAKLVQWGTYLSEAFLALVAAGGLGGSRHEPEVTASLDRMEWWVADLEEVNAACWSAPNLRIDPGALRVLANLVEGGMYALECPVYALHVRYDQVTVAVDDLDFPSVWPHLPFDVEEYPIESRNFNVEAVFETLTATELVALLKAAVSWFETVTHGGFGGHPYAQWKNGLETNQSYYSFTATSVLFHIREFYAHPDALASLINLLMAATRDGPRIEQVIVAE